MDAAGHRQEGDTLNGDHLAKLIELGLERDARRRCVPNADRAGCGMGAGGLTGGRIDGLAARRYCRMVTVDAWRRARHDGVRYTALRSSICLGGDACRLPLLLAMADARNSVSATFSRLNGMQRRGAPGIHREHGIFLHGRSVATARRRPECRA